MIFVFNGVVNDISTFSTFVDSIKKFSFSKVMIFCENKTKVNLEQVCQKAFTKNNFQFNNFINKKQADWQNLYEEIDDYIWVCSKYDHFFIDKNIDHIKEVLNFRTEAGTDKLASINLSNWLESLTKCVIIDHGIWDGEKHPAPTQAWITIDECDSFQIATKSLFFSWFFDQDFGSVEIKSMEELNDKIALIRPWKVQVPSREILRNKKDIIDEYDFNNDCLTKQQRKEMIIKYYFSKISLGKPYLANPRFDKGIFERILRYYGFTKKENTHG